MPHLGPGDETSSDRGVDVTPGHVTNGLSHGGHGDTKTQGDADILSLGRGIIILYSIIADMKD